MANVVNTRNSHKISMRNSFLLGNKILPALIVTICLTQHCAKSLQISGYRVESPNFFNVTYDGKLTVLSGADVRLRVFLSAGQTLTTSAQFSFTETAASSGTNCDDLRSSQIFNASSVSGDSALVVIRLYSQQDEDSKLVKYLMFCVRDPGSTTTSGWIHQGNSSSLLIAAHPAHPAYPADDDSLAPIWVKCLLIVVFISFSGLFTGLGLGLLSLTKLELKVLRNLGSLREKRYAKVVYPLRKKGNFLFCTITFVNALANIAVTILFYELIGLYSILAATLSIVFIGEVLPQTVCSFFGLAVGSKIIVFTNLFMIVTFPFTYPVGKLMDWILKEEVPSVYNRDRLVELVKAAERRAGASGGAEGGQVQGQVGKGGQENVTVGGGVLNLSNKSVKDIMTRLEDVYMLEYNTELNHELLGEILKAGYTRIPVYDTERSNVVAMLHVKDLSLVQPDDKTSLKTLCKFYNRPVNFVFEDTKLDVMLEEFKRGQSHMAFLQRVNSDGPGDPFYETLGMLTLEDVIEEIFQPDDVSNVIPRNNGSDKLKEDVPNINKLNAAILSDFNQQRKEASISTSLIQAASQFLIKYVEPFSEDYITERVLERLFVQDVVQHLSVGDVSNTAGPAPDDADKLLYENGKACNHFVLILEGRVEVTIGRDNLTFTCGPFQHFGVQALKDVIDPASKHSSLNPTASDIIMDEMSVTSLTFTPDYSVRPITDVTYLRVTRSMYVTACQAAALQKQGEREMRGAEPLSPRRVQLIHDYIEHAPPYEYNSRTELLDRGLGGPASPPYVENVYLGPPLEGGSSEQGEGGTKR